MKQRQAQSHWDKAYRSRPEDAHSWFEVEPVTSLHLISTAAMAAGDAMIDVGGGASVLVDTLLAQGYTDLTVLDISRTALAKARERLGANSAQVEWICNDIRAFEPRRGYRLWHDRALFHFLNDPADQARYVEVLQAAVERGGQVIIATFAVGGPERCSGLDIIQYDGRRLMATIGTGFRLLWEGRETHRTPTGANQRFAWFRLQRV